MTLYARWSTATYTVSFNAGEGISGPEAQTVPHGSTVTEPAAPAKTGFVLAGWYKEAGLTNPWNFAADTVTAAMTLYAKWSTATHTVAFNANGGAPVPAVQTVAAGGKVTEPTPAPAKTGLSFGGWYEDAALTGQWDFGTDTVTADMTLYAKWTATVTFNANGGSYTPAVQTVAAGGKATEPTPAPAKTGFVLAGWYKEAGLISQWNFAADTVTADMTLYAKWDRIPGDKTTYSGESITFEMAWVPGGGLSFPTEIVDSGTATVAAAYEIGETEVTYELWYTVRAWAESHGYTFYNNPGLEGSSGSSQNTTPGTNKQEPVTMVTWFDAVVWLNALTEWVNAKTGSSLEPVYYYQSAYTTVARNSAPSSNFVKEEGGHTYASAYAKAGADGFRLPTRNEWELAARWRND
jgi:uncharacterized repeat protein (TIGR02543 family)